MKKLLYILLPLCLLLSCTQIGGQRTVQVELTAATATSADKAYDFACSTTVGYATDAGDGANASVSLVGVNHISGSFEVSSSATTLWCFTPGAYGEGNAFSIPAQVVKVSPVTSDEIDGMVFCSSGVALSSQGPGAPDTGTPSAPAPASSSPLLRRWCLRSWIRGASSAARSLLP